MNLRDNVERSIYIIRETETKFEKPCILWSTSKDSTAVLQLIRESFSGAVPFPVIHIDTGWKFPEIYEFRNKIAEEWMLDLKVARSPLVGKIAPTSGASKKDCCKKLKTDVLREVIEDEGYDAVITSMRRDELYKRDLKRRSSSSDKRFRWRLFGRKGKDEEGDAHLISGQDTELWNVLIRDLDEEFKFEVRHPMLHWTELDVWLYTRDRRLPVNPLHISKDGIRYKRLSCMQCTTPIKSNASTIEEIINELEMKRTPEEADRPQDEEREKIIRKLRELGYM